MEGVYGWKIRRYNKKCKKNMLYSSNDTYTIIITTITITIIINSSITIIIIIITIIIVIITDKSINSMIRKLH